MGIHLAVPAEEKEISNLSHVEATAGISRAALNVAKRNGHKAGSDVNDRVHSGPEIATNVSIPGRPPERTTVLKTWARDLDVINVNGWSFHVRDTQHLSDRAQVTTLYLTRPEMEMLAKRISEVLREVPA